MKSRAPADEAYYVASQWQLMWRKYKRHKLAFIGMGTLFVLYLAGIFCEFFAPYDPYARNAEHTFATAAATPFCERTGA